MLLQDTIIITGGAGFIGTNFVRKCLSASEWRVITLDKLTYAGHLENLENLADDPRHSFVEGDICDAGLWSRLFAEHAPRAVVNFAAESHVDRSIDGSGVFVQTNIVGVHCLLEAARTYHAGLDGAARAAFRLLHVSTDEVFGSLERDDPAFHEATPYAPNSPYSASKAAADHLVRAYFHTYGLPVLTTNCSNNYGPYQFPEKLFPVVINNALAGRPLPIYGDGSNVRDWLFVEDHCEAVLRVLTAGTPGETYNVGGNAERTNLEVVHAICAALDALLPDSPHCPHAGLIEFVTDRPGHDRRYAIDASKLKRTLAWSPRHSFDEGLRATVAWYVDNQHWCERVTDGNYQGQRLGLAAGSN
jgi:dTDP-glucose 4,6-dehydratase